jgi:hypothetical protein
VVIYSLGSMTLYISFVIELMQLEGLHNNECKEKAVKETKISYSSIG